MLIEIKVGIVLYVIMIMANLVIMTIIRLKARKSSTLDCLTACQVALVLWLFLAVIENLAKSTPQYQFVVTKVIILLNFLGPLWLHFTLEYLEIPRTGSKKWHYLIFIPAAASSVFMLLNPYSPLIIRTMDGFTAVEQWGNVFIINSALTYLMVFVSSALIIGYAIRKRKLISESIMIVVSTLIPIAFHGLYYFDLIEATEFDLAPITLTFLMALVATLVFQNKLLDVFPFASQELFSNISEAILIIDLNGQVTEYNVAFRKLFDPYFDVGGCRSIREFHDSLLESIDSAAEAGRVSEALLEGIWDSPVEFIIQSPDMPARQLTCTSYPFVDHDQKEIGASLSFHDITEYRSRTLQTERTRLSNDLHDSLGNSLNIISSNLEYSISRLQDEPEIRDYLQTSYNRTTSAFLDLRRIVEDLHPIDIENNGLIWALESLIGRLNDRGVHIDFDHYLKDYSILSRSLFSESIYFICQEAINNAITHGKAQNIQIVLNQNAGALKLYISDDGIGCAKIVKNKGLNSMQQRVGEMDGLLEYGSPSEGGFIIKITLPVLLLSLKENENDQTAHRR
ncbi:MAG: histidine kinase N-terminal 7TM domain-containing protein [Saccharofermentanales bacterium]